MSRVDRGLWALSALGLAYFDLHAIAASYLLPAVVLALLTGFAAWRALAPSRSGQVTLEDSAR